MKRGVLVALVSILTMLLGCGPKESVPLSPTPNTSPTQHLLPASGAGWRLINVPKGGESLEGAQWIEVDAPGGYKLNAAVFYPSTPGLFPVVLILHGTDGFQAPYAIIGQEFANAGFLTVAGAWFKGNASNQEADKTLIPIDCPNGPPFTGANIDSTKYVKALINASQSLPGAMGQNIGLIGFSRGANEALLAASADGVKAIVADSGHYNTQLSFDTAPISLVKDLSVPVLILYGTADQTVPFQVAKDYETALREQNKSFEIHGYEGGPHVVTTYPTTKIDALKREFTFFDKYLTSSASSRSGSPWFGAHITNITPELAQAMKLKPDQQGALIIDITADSPADKAGLHSSDQIVTINGEETHIGGDIIIAIDGKSINNMSDFVAYLFGSEIGQTIILTVLRQGKEETIRVTVGSRPSS